MSEPNFDHRHFRVTIVAEEAGAGEWHAVSTAWLIGTPTHLNSLDASGSTKQAAISSCAALVRAQIDATWTWFQSRGATD